MGKEYEIKCSSEAVARFDNFVRRSNFLQSFDDEHQMYVLKMSGDENEWPDGCARVHENRIYFCDYMTSTLEIAHIFRRIVDHAMLFSDSIEITEP